MNIYELLRSRTTVNPDTGCWEWQGARTRWGYGDLHINGEHWRAHRLMLTVTRGLDPEKHCLHLCDNPPCINPDHLIEGTNLENVRQRQARGRTTGERPKTYYTFNGKSQMLHKWAEELGVNKYTLSNRLNRMGWSVERAFTEPVKQKKGGGQNQYLR